MTDRRAGPEAESLTLMHELDARARCARQKAAAVAAGVPVCFADTLADGGEGPALVVIPPGHFEMGSPEDEPGREPVEGPLRYVRLKHAFALGRCTVTADAFGHYARESGWRPRPDLIQSLGLQPMINLRPREAQAYVDWLSWQTGYRYRLPTEAEWEYAARAGTRTPFAFGKSVDCSQVSYNPAFPYPPGVRRPAGCLPWARLREAGSLPANLWGLHEMHGNVWEMTLSPWCDDLGDVDSDGHAHPSSGAPSRLTTRGGSWFDPAALARSAVRRPRLADELDTNLGLRILRELT